MNVLVNKKVCVQHLGLVEYEQARKCQQKLFESIIELKLQNREKTITDTHIIPNYLLICQHPHVYTLGNSGNIDNLLATDNELLKFGAKFYKTNRGGDITYHGPGQLVIYPVIDLENFFTDIHKYLRLLEEAVIQTLAHHEITSGRVEGKTGVWVDATSHHPRKVCAMGIRSSRWVVMHGLALNINTDMSYFQRIIPCGISDKSVTSMSLELHKKLDFESVTDDLIIAISKLFEMNLII